MKCINIVLAIRPTAWSVLATLALALVANKLQTDITVLDLSALICLILFAFCAFPIEAKCRTTESLNSKQRNDWHSNNRTFAWYAWLRVQAVLALPLAVAGIVLTYLSRN